MQTCWRYSLSCILRHTTLCNIAPLQPHVLIGSHQVVDVIKGLSGGKNIKIAIL